MNRHSDDHPNPMLPVFLTVFIDLVGFSILIPIFPLLIAETPAQVGERHAAHAIGFQISAATLGAGALPALAGLLVRHVGLESLGPFLLGTTVLLLLLHERGARR